MHVRPCRLFHRQPVTVRLQPPLEQPLRFFFLRGDEADDLFAQPRRGDVGLDLRDEAVLVVLFCNFLDFEVAHTAASLAARSCLSMTGTGIPPRTRSPSVTCSNAPLIARLMPNMNRREGQATRIAQVALPWSSKVSHSTRSHGPSRASMRCPRVMLSESPSNE